MRKVIHGKPIDYDKAFSAEAVLEQLERDKERLIKLWGQESYDLRRKQIEDYIAEKRSRAAKHDVQASGNGVRKP